MFACDQFSFCSPTGEWKQFIDVLACITSFIKGGAENIYTFSPLADANAFRIDGSARLGVNDDEQNKQTNETKRNEKKEEYVGRLKIIIINATYLVR